MNYETWTDLCKYCAIYSIFANFCIKFYLSFSLWVSLSSKNTWECSECTWRLIRDIIELTDYPDKSSSAMMNIIILRQKKLSVEVLCKRGVHECMMVWAVTCKIKATPAIRILCLGFTERNCNLVVILCADNSNEGR